MDNKSFDSKRIADGYKKRPWLHKYVMEAVKRDLGISDEFRFKNGLDVGCGAGLSTKALHLICDRVTGTDISEAMVSACKALYSDPAYSFYTAKAEETIVPHNKYDIVTAAGCINWVDEEAFMKNMKEVTSENAIIVIYDFGITDKMRDESEYFDWYNTMYLNEFPKPPRNENKWNQNDLIDGFIMEKQTEYELDYRFNLNDFVDFMMIQSNVNSRIESGDISEHEARQWMSLSLAHIFDDNEKTLIFRGYTWYIRIIRPLETI